MIPATYAHDPIVEAVADVSFAGGSWSPAIAEKVIGAFRSEYPGPARPRGIQIIVGPGLGPVPQLGTATLLPSSDGKALVSVGPNVLSVHVLAPYPGWANFRPRIERALATLIGIASPTAVQQVAIRYIDQIGPLAPEVGITDYFPCMASRPESMPKALDGFHVVTQASDAAERFTAILRLASLPARPPDPTLQVLYDLNMLRPFDPPLPVDVQAVLGHLDFLHARQRRIFEDSISEQTRSLFK